MTANLDRSLADVRNDPDLIAYIYTYAKQTLAMPGYQAQLFAGRLDFDLADWGPDDATLRDVLNAAHRRWTGTD